ncbi:MAG: hypothetical protein H6571_21800 [Lewinellaceae bacterium]|nr:hypothetical protein [Lewinellaceae bacterium]
MKNTKNNQHITLLLNSLFYSKTDSRFKASGSIEINKTLVSPIKVICDYAINSLINNGGFTISHTGLVPIFGYAISIYKDRERKYTTLDRHDIAEYIKANTDLLKLPNSFLGGWKFQKHIFLDVSLVLQSLEKAKYLARKHEQISIFSLYENVDFSNESFTNSIKILDHEKSEK